MKRNLVWVVLAASAILAACSGRNDVPESVLWINGTHAVLTRVNGGDVSRFGTMPANAVNRTMMRTSLEQWWGVTSRQELESVIDSLSRGAQHNQRFMSEAEMYGITAMSRGEFEAALQGVASREDALFFRNMFEAYQAFGANAIMGWDLSRATQLSAHGYVAGFFTRDEAIDIALGVGALIQGAFDSRADFYRSYMFGFAYWSGADFGDPRSEFAGRAGIAEALMSEAGSPLALAWRTELNR